MLNLFVLNLFMLNLLMNVKFPVTLTQWLKNPAEVQHRYVMKKKVLGLKANLSAVFVILDSPPPLRSLCHTPAKMKMQKWQWPKKWQHLTKNDNEKQIDNYSKNQQWPTKWPIIDKNDIVQKLTTINKKWWWSIKMTMTSKNDNENKNDNDQKTMTNKMTMTNKGYNDQKWHRWSKTFQWTL